MQILNFITAKDIFILILGGILSYIIGLIVSAQTKKNKDLTVGVVERELILEEKGYYPYTLVDKESGEVLNSCYRISLMIWNKKNIEIKGTLEENKNTDVNPKNPLIISIDSVAKVIGHPIVSFKNKHINCLINKISHNYYQIDFDCLNPQEAIQVDFYISGDGYAIFDADARIYGGKIIPFTDDNLLTRWERLNALLTLIIYLLTPIFLIAGLIWLLSDFSLIQLFKEPESLPKLLSIFLGIGIAGSVIIIFSISRPLIKRKQLPKNYPMEEVDKLNIFQLLKFYWIAAKTGKKSEVEKYVYDNIYRK